jgi:uncharacterized protein involved in type VI secretion and phage assembly
MISGVVIGTVLENQDPSGMHRVLVRYNVESGEELKSSWCRMISPMAGKDRGMVMLPEVGTEVILGFAYRSMSAYVLGAVYNGGDDKPEGYANEDGDNNLRVFWSRGDHMVIFDDTSGAEKVEIGAQASSAGDVTSAPIYQSMDSAQKVITMFCEKNTEVEAVGSISLKCKDFVLETDAKVTIDAGVTATVAGSSSATIESSSSQSHTAAHITVGIGPSASAASAPSSPSPSHSPG